MVAQEGLLLRGIARFVSTHTENTYKRERWGCFEGPVRIPTHISGDAFFAGRSSRNQPQPGLVGGSSAQPLPAVLPDQTHRPDGSARRCVPFRRCRIPRTFLPHSATSKHVQRFHFALCGAPRLVDAFPDVTRSGIRVFGNVEQDLQPQRGMLSRAQRMASARARLRDMPTATHPRTIWLSCFAKRVGISGAWRRLLHRHSRARPLFRPSL